MRQLLPSQQFLPSRSEAQTDYKFLKNGVFCVDKKFRAQGKCDSSF